MASLFYLAFPLEYALSDRFAKHEERAEPAATAQRLDGARFEFRVARSAWLTRDRSAMNYLVNKALLDLHDKYDGDLGLLDERWASQEDRDAFSSEQVRTLGEYIEKLRISKTGSLAQEFKSRVETRIKELEENIDPVVVEILRKRME
ncbi:MAG: hypothetical protein QM760_11410 [Nibricoccus sp.]